MRSFLPRYSLVAPSSLPEVLALLRVSPPRRPFAGGTDLMVLLEAGTLPEGEYVGLWNLRELRGIDDSGNAIAIGALTTYTEIARHPLLQTHWPLLCRAAEETGGVATQNRGTIGGNIANASPAADTPPALIVYDAELEIVSSRGTRRVPYDRFHTGYKQMDLGADELIARIHLPKRPGSWRQVLQKGGDAPRAGHCQGVRGGGVRHHCRSPDRRHPHRAGQRGANGRACARCRRRVAWSWTDRCHHNRRGSRTGTGDRPHRRHPLQRAISTARVPRASS